MPLTFLWKGSTALPVEGESLRPEAFVGTLADEVARRTVRVGNSEVELGDLFAVSGDAGDGTIRLEGDLRHVRRIGRGMTTGLIRICGDCGTGLGQGMVGGEITVEGSVENSAGMGMRGGLLRICGSAGDNLGGAEPGARLGMRDGVILVEGHLGNDAGLSMRRGLIAVTGDCGMNLGRGLIAGTIFAFGRVGQGTGRGMKRGSIVLFDEHMPKMGPGFSPSGADRPTFVAIFLNRLRGWGFSVPDFAFTEPYSRYNGDRTESGQGEILIAGGSP